MSDDVRFLARELERLHPGLFHDLSRRRWAKAVDSVVASYGGLSRDERLVALMRLAALPGVRDGHTGLYPLQPHRRPLRMLPLQLYHFADGMHVVASPHRGLVGRRLLAIGGVPVERIVRAVEPLVGRDNEATVRARLPEFLVTAEVLRGLGLVGGAGRRRVAVDGGLEVRLEPVSADDWSGLFRGPLPRRRTPAYLARAGRDWWTAALDDEGVIHAAYNRTQAFPAFVARLRELVSRPGFRRLILDLRLNGGGNNTRYGDLLALLRERPVNRRGRLVVLVGRHTFSAAGNLAADIERSTRAVFVGEPTGGAPNQYGDAIIVTLPRSGWGVRVATVYHEFAAPDDPRLAVAPDIAVEPSAADFVAGRDPVLDAARRLPLNLRSTRERAS